jgi:DNA-binding phage protein
MGKIDKIIELGKKLPRGARKRIAEKSGCSRSLVVHFFLGTKRPTNKTVLKILKATKEVLKTYENESNEINSMIDSIKL